MKTTHDRFVDALLKKFSALPGIHQMVQEQAAIDESEGLAKRMRVLSELKTLRGMEATAAKALETAMAAKKAAEAKVEPLHKNVCLALNEFNNVYGARQAREQDYMQLHGEGLIHLTLSRLQAARNNAAAELLILKNRKVGPLRSEAGGFYFPKNDPETVAFFADRTKELEAYIATLDKLVIEASKYIEVELSPLAIQVRMAALIDAAGLKPSAPELATH